jgi:hypothetical protein
MKFTLVFVTLVLAGIGFWYTQPADQSEATARTIQPPPTALTVTPRSRFTPTTRKGYYNLDVVDDFTLPVSKTVTFCGAGRNLHVQQDRTKLFRRGFTSLDQSRMVPQVEIWSDGFPPAGWRSVLKQSQRAMVIYQNYFFESFQLPWARNGNLGKDVLYQAPPNARTNRSNIYQAALELQGGCVGFGDCPQGGMKSTYGKLFLDIENDGVNRGNEQEQANLYTFLIKTLKDNVSSQTEVGSITPVPHNSFGYSKAEDYTARAEWLWNMPAQHTATSRQRGMPNSILGKSYSDFADFQMPGTYYLYPELDYSASHNRDGDRHWLAALLGEQEVNLKLSPKKRIAWHWLFNTQSAAFANSGKAEHPAPPAIAEGMGIFYWFTGAYGVILWDDYIDLTPDQPSPRDPAQKGLGSDRNYACYEHYVHGLWRLFKHHGDLFNGREKYLNEATECSYDGGKTWATYNANQIKTRNLPFVRAIVNGDQILVAATRAYARPNQTTQVMVRYVQDGYNFNTTLTLKGDEIFLGRAKME